MEATQKRKRLSAADRREAILDAALEVFAARGYHAASIDHIAASGGISKALIYEHFPSKKDLHASLLERHTAEILGRLTAATAALDSDEERLRAGVDAFFKWTETRHQAFRLLFRDVFESDVAEVLASLQRQATLAIAALMMGGGEHHEAAIEPYAQQLSGAVQSLAIWWEDHRDIERSYLVDRVMDFAWLGLDRIRPRGRASVT